MSFSLRRTSRLQNSFPQPLARTGTLLLLIAAALALLAPAAPAATSCERKVIDDWYDNGRVDQIYPTQCYRGAIKSLPTDVLDYSSARNDILRALAFARRGEQDPGRSGATTPAATTPEPTETTKPTPTPKPTPKPTPTPGLTATIDTGPDFTDAAPTVSSTSSSSSVPVPLIVLGGLAVLLCAGGVAAYLVRRFRGGDEPPLA